MLSGKWSGCVGMLDMKHGTWMGMLVVFMLVAMPMVSADLYPADPCAGGVLVTDDASNFYMESPCFSITFPKDYTSDIDFYDKYNDDAFDLKLMQIQDINDDLPAQKHVTAFSSMGLTASSTFDSVIYTSSDGNTRIGYTIQGNKVKSIFEHDDWISDYPTGRFVVQTRIHKEDTASSHFINLAPIVDSVEQSVNVTEVTHGQNKFYEQVMYVGSSFISLVLDPIYAVDYSPDPAEHLIGGSVSVYNDSEFDSHSSITVGVSDDNDSTTYLTAATGKNLVFDFSNVTGWIERKNSNKGNFSVDSVVYRQGNSSFVLHWDLENLNQEYSIEYAFASQQNWTNTPYVCVWSRGDSNSNTVQFNLRQGSTYCYSGSTVLKNGTWVLNQFDFSGCPIINRVEYSEIIVEATNDTLYHKTWVDGFYRSNQPCRNGTAIVGRWSQTYNSSYDWWLRVRKTTAGTSDVRVYAYSDIDSISAGNYVDDVLSGIGWFNINVSSLMEYENVTAGLNYTQLRFYSSDIQYFSEVVLRREENDTQSPIIYNCLVNDTILINNEVARFQCNVTDDIDVDYVNGTIEGVVYNLTKQDDVYYYDWQCTATNPSVDWTLIEAVDLLGNYNSTNPGLSVSCTYNMVNISLTDAYGVDSVGTKIYGFNTTNLEEIERFVLNFTVDFSGTFDDWYFNFTANSTGSCSLGNKQNTVCYNLTNPIDSRWIQFIDGVETSSFKDEGATGDFINAIVSAGASQVNISILIDEHYNPNVFKWYDAEYNFSDVKWQNGTDQKLHASGRFIRIELDTAKIPLDADQYKLDFRVNHTNPDAKLEAYLCNSTYTTGHAYGYAGCSKVAEKLPSELQDDGTKFRGIFTSTFVQTIGDIKYVVLEAHGGNATNYYELKTYKALASNYTTHWEYSIDEGATWNNSGDGYETELNINWFYDGAAPTSFVYSVFANVTSGVSDVFVGNITWDIDPTNNYPPLVNILQPYPGSVFALPQTIHYYLLDFNNDTLNGTIYIYYPNGTLFDFLETNLTESGSYVWSAVIDDGFYKISVEACETSTPELYCGIFNSTVEVNRFVGTAEIDTLILWHEPFTFVGHNETIHASVRVGNSNYAGAYVNIYIDNSTGLMAWDNITSSYIIYWIAPAIGVFDFNVTAQANVTLTNSSSIEVIDSADLYSVCISLWNDINMTGNSSYKNEFAWVYGIHQLGDPTLKRLFDVSEKYSCPPQSPEGSHCMWHGEYINGTACVDLFLPGNYTFYIVGNNIEWEQDIGSGWWEGCDYCNYHAIQKRFLLNLGNYQFNGDMNETLDLYYSPTELYYSGAFFGLLTSWVMLAVYAILALVAFVFTLWATNSLKSAMAMLVLLPTLIHIIISFTL